MAIRNGPPRVIRLRDGMRKKVFTKKVMEITEINHKRMVWFGESGSNMAENPKSEPGGGQSGMEEQSENRGIARTNPGKRVAG